MQKDSRIFDDFAKLASGAAGTVLDMKREIEALVMDKMEKLMGRMQLVKREEFEVARLMVEQARAEQEKLAKRVAKLEKLLESSENTEKVAPGKPSRK